MGPTYRWTHQLICDIPKAVLADKLYDLSLHGLTDDGTKVGDVLRVGTDDKPPTIVSGYNKPIGNACVMAGDPANIPVRGGMGVSFTFEKCESLLREIVTCGGNPSINACHGFVEGILNGADGQPELSIRLALHKGNLPPFLKWNRLSQDAVLQTNLAAIIPARWVVSTFSIMPIPLHNLAGVPPEELFTIGNAACPIHRNVFIAGQIDIFPGSFPPGELWSRRYENEKLKSFSLLSDFCLRGGAVTDESYKEQAIWKRGVLATMQTVAHLKPRAELNRISPFPPMMALETICASQTLFGTPPPGTYIFDLHAAVIRFAASKARRAKNGAGSVCIMPLVMPGNMLLQLVTMFATVSNVRFKEGAVEAVVEHFPQAEKLLGSKDGVFNREGSGIVQLFAPITARWVLYNPKAGAEDTAYVGSGGRAELEFNRFVGMDRNGGELTGDLNRNDRFSALTSKGGGGGSGGAPAGDCHSNQWSSATESDSGPVGPKPVTHQHFLS
jgi:hypothetical protein